MKVTLPSGEKASVFWAIFDGDRQLVSWDRRKDKVISTMTRLLSSSSIRRKTYQMKSQVRPKPAKIIPVPLLVNQAK